MSRQADLAKIHIARKQLAMDDETYRALLREIAGVDSSAALDFHGRFKVLERLKTLGFRAKTTSSKKTHRMSKDGHIRKIQALWLDMARLKIVRDESAKALDSYVKRLTSVQSVHWLSGSQANTVIEALKNWQKREGAA